MLTFLKQIVTVVLVLVSPRCQLRDKEVECREKDAEIMVSKEKVVNLVRQLASQKSELRQLELQNSELIKQEKLMVSTFFNRISIIIYFSSLGTCLTLSIEFINC